MFDSFPDSTYETLDNPTYLEEFYQHLKDVRSMVKLERGQHFQEKGFASWEAFAAGEWDRALALAAERREQYAQQISEAKRHGSSERRLRVVEFPITPYVQWEMHVLRVRVEVGDNIRVLDARKIAEIEREHKVPEVVILGDAVVFEVLYDEEGNGAGARRYLDPALIRETSAGFEALYERGEDFVGFFDREIAPLGAPSAHCT